MLFGLTMLLVLQAVLKDKQDDTSIRLVFANQTEEDILLRPELDAFALDSRFEIHYVLSRPKNPKEWICGSTGRCAKCPKVWSIAEFDQHALRTKLQHPELARYKQASSLSMSSGKPLLS